jgi:hypothetical protein
MKTWFLPDFSGLKRLIITILTFARNDFNLRIYAFVGLFLTASASINYYFSIDDDYLEPLSGSIWGMFLYFLFYGFSYFSVAIPILIWTNSKETLSKPTFWIRSVLFIGFIGIEGGVAISPEWLSGFGLEYSEFWARKTLRQLESIFVWIPVYYIFLKWNDPSLKEGLYGIRWRFEDLKPYLSMLWVMVPLIAMASFLPDFQNQYPVFKRVLGYLPGNSILERSVSLAVYEFSYLLSFMTTELMFRGALIIGMSGILGPKAVLPMVSTYMFLHFGKPLGESISSVFGGYILAVLAFQNRNIWGGIFIHTCVALLMDLAAGWQLFPKLYDMLIEP